jgi:hypothetical protein
VSVLRFDPFRDFNRLSPSRWPGYVVRPEASRWMRTGAEASFLIHVDLPPDPIRRRSN